MIIKTNQFPASPSDAFTIQMLTSEHAVCFDIETTGFSVSNTCVYLIGCIYYDGNLFQTIQWLSESKSDEPEVLQNFFTFIRPFKMLIHYNGEGFDMPYLINRCRRYQMPYDFTDFRSLDLYKLLAPYKSLLGLENLKQKTLETFLGIQREDLFHGGELISVYYDYETSKDASLEQTLLLHNYEDLCGMCAILPAFSYYELFHGLIETVSYKLNSYRSASGKPKEEILFSFQMLHPVPQKISCRKDAYYLSCQGTTGAIAVQIYEDELKYFFPNYKDYYYLPMEDMSIHKSVALYVDKDFRTQATAANCYNRKSGKFLPQHTEIIKPFFKKNYKDKKTYFELTEEFLADKDQMLLYVKHLLTILNTK